MAKCLNIGQVAKLIGVNPKTIRYYEEIGVLPPAKRSEVVHGKGYRLYMPEDLRRLEFIKQARLLDLPLRDIRELVSAVEDGCCSSVNPKLVRLVEKKRGEIDQRIADLEALRKVLNRLGRELRKTLIPPEPRKRALPIMNIPCRDERCDAPKP